MTLKLFIWMEIYGCEEQSNILLLAHTKEEAISIIQEKQDKFNITKELDNYNSILEIMKKEEPDVYDLDKSRLLGRFG